LKPKVQNDRVQTTEMMEKLFLQVIFTHESFSSAAHVFVIKLTSTILGQYGIWISNNQSLLISSLQYLASALTLVDARSSSAKSIMQLCSSCGKQIAKMDSSVLLNIINALEVRILILSIYHGF